ncbi:MAG: hypothetical protein HQL22_01390, partial [Candidatus Omnitrophica bacterium]|nr:hypothetical protein [Candidatus Omnitrophota bacterium]
RSLYSWDQDVVTKGILKEFEAVAFATGAGGPGANCIIIIKDPSRMEALVEALMNAGRMNKRPLIAPKIGTKTVKAEWITADKKQEDIPLEPEPSREIRVEELSRSLDASEAMTGSLALSIVSIEGFYDSIAEKFNELATSRDNGVPLEQVYADADAFAHNVSTPTDQIVFDRKAFKFALASEVVDNAEKLKGGVDLNTSQALTAKGDAADFKFDAAQIERFKQGDFAGVTAVIINITPVQGWVPILGMETGAGEDQPAKG